MIARALAYVICSIPAAIGVWFVARYAYATSDTPTDAYSNAFLFGMIAVGAYVCPALAIVIGRRNRGAAAFFWLAAILAIATNWSNTLGAITNRGAGLEAERVKAAKSIKDDEKRMAHIERELATLPVVAVTSETIAAANAAVRAAERARQAECDKRGPMCRQRETEEQAKRDALTGLSSDKAKSDLRERLSAEAAGIRARQTNAPAVKAANTIGLALEKLMPWMDADTASTAQHGLMSLIVELLIAAFIALPELLSSPQRGRANVAESAVSAPRSESQVQRRARPTQRSGPEPRTALSVAEYASARLRPSDRGRLSVDELYADYRAAASQKAVTALAAEEFAAEFARLCEGTTISAAEERGVIYLSKVQIANGSSRRLGKMVRSA